MKNFKVKKIFFCEMIFFIFIIGVAWFPTKPPPPPPKKKRSRWKLKCPTKIWLVPDACLPIQCLFLVKALCFLVEVRKASGMMRKGKLFVGRVAMRHTTCDPGVGGQKPGFIQLEPQGPGGVLSCCRGDCHLIRTVVASVT